MKKIVLSLIIILPFFTCFSQISPNEKLIYSASYNMSGLMTKLAQVSITTEPISTSKKTFYHISLIATTFSKWDNFFKIRDLYESYVDPSTLIPSLYKRSIDEGGYTKNEKYIFKSDHKTVEGTTKTKRGEVKKTFTIGTSTYDVATLILKLRMLDFQNMKIGQKRLLTLVFDQKEFPVSIKMLGIESVSGGNLGKKECYKISISSNTNKLRGTDKNLIWITNDKKRVPVLIKFSIPVGTGQLDLFSCTN